MSRVIGRPPSPAITVYTESGEPEDVRTLAETMPPRPTPKAFSRTMTLFALPSAWRIAAVGHGRKQVMPSTPNRWPLSRSSSTVSLMVPSTEPRATTIVSASSVR